MTLGDTVTIWEDENNRSYKVMYEYGKYRAYYLDNEDDHYYTWQPCRNFKPKDTFKEAEQDLKEWATKQNMRIFGSYEDVSF